MTDLRDQLQSLFLTAVAAATERMRSLDVPLTVEVDALDINRDGTGGWSPVQTKTTQNVLKQQDGAVLLRVAPILTEEAVAEGLTCASGLAASPETHLPFYSPSNYNHGWLLDHGPSGAGDVIPEYGDDPARWTLGHLIWPALLHHLKTAAALDKVGTAEAGAFAGEVLAFATQDHLTYRVTIPLAGIRLPPNRKTALVADDAELRSLSSLEQGQILEARGGIQRIWQINPIFQLPEAALALSIHSDRNAYNPDPTETIADWFCAFHLHGFQPVGRDAQIQPHPAWAGLYTLRIPVKTQELCREHPTVTAADFRTISATVEKLEQYHLGQPTSPHDVALQRLSMGSSRSSATDALVDFVIALEALLLPYDSHTRHGDLSHRFRLHGAHYLASKKADRTHVYDQLRDLYDLRSRIVHGGGNKKAKFPTPEELEQGRHQAAELARTGLVRALKEGFPDAALYKKLLMGA